MSIFKGCATALVTPFSDSGVDYDSLGRLIDFQIENDVGALATGRCVAASAQCARSQIVSPAIYESLSVWRCNFSCG